LTLLLHLPIGQVVMTAASCAKQVLLSIFTVCLLCCSTWYLSLSFCSCVICFTLLMLYTVRTLQIYALFSQYNSSFFF
jgi:hypothetical protein